MRSGPAYAILAFPACEQGPRSLQSRHQAVELLLQGFVLVNQVVHRRVEGDEPLSQPLKTSVDLMVGGHLDVAALRRRKGPGYPKQIAV